MKLHDVETTATTTIASASDLIRRNNSSQVWDFIRFENQTYCLNLTQAESQSNLVEAFRDSSLHSARNELTDDVLCLLYEPQFVSCFKWRLNPTEYTVADNGTVFYTTPTHTERYKLGYYSVSEGDILHVCIPPDLLSPVAYIDFLIMSLWVVSFTSLFFLLMTCPLFRQNRTGTFWPLMFHIFSLLIRYGIHIFYELQTNPTYWCCVFIALVAHISFNSASCWLNVVTFDMWRQLRRRKFNPNEPYTWRKFLFQGLYAWGAPTAMVSVTVLLGLGPFDEIAGYKERCLITLYFNEPQVAFFFTCMSLFVVINVIFVILTFITLCRKIPELNFANDQIYKQVVSTNVKLIVMSGVTWLLLIVERVSYPLKPDPMMLIIEEIITSLQGVYLLAIYACTASNRRRFRRLLQVRCINDRITE